MHFKNKNTFFIFIFAAFTLFLTGCGTPSQDHVAEAFISYTLAVPTESDVTNDTATTGTVIDTFTGVAEDTYGYTFNGIVRSDFDGTTYTYSGTLSLTGGKVAVLILDYISAAGVLTGTITGDETAIDVATVVLPEE